MGRLAALAVLVCYAAGVVAIVWLNRRIDQGSGNPVEDAIVTVGFGMFAVVGALLVARRPGNPVGWILSATSLVVLTSALETYAAYVMTTTGRPDWLAVVGAWANGWYWFLFILLAFIFLPLYFPDGRLPSRRLAPRRRDLGRRGPDHNRSRDAPRDACAARTSTTGSRTRSG